MPVNFAFYAVGDAYSTAQKIMGRQSAGASLLRGLFKKASSHRLVACCGSEAVRADLATQAKSSGYRGEFDFDISPDVSRTEKLGTLYYPAPPIRDIAHLRNLNGPESFSLFGVTHTLSSKGAGDQISDLILPPFMPWDALVCTSTAAKTFVTGLHDDLKEYWGQSIGATRFVDIQLPVIPLGINAEEFSPNIERRFNARGRLGIADSDVVLLFVGRLAFHAKANPLAFYKALNDVSHDLGNLPGNGKIVVVEVGVHPNQPVKEAYKTAQNALCPPVRFIHIDGNDTRAFTDAWALADIFVSLSDNIQETFGITPVEAMASSLPVIVSDWNGYKDTVRHGVDGFRVATILPGQNSGVDLSARYAVDVDTYDMYIGRASLATVVDPDSLRASLSSLIGNKGLRQEMGESGRRRVLEHYDWSIVLEKYNQLSAQLTELRHKHSLFAQFSILPQRYDPFFRFSHFSTETLLNTDCFQIAKDGVKNFNLFKDLSISNYGFKTGVFDLSLLHEVFERFKSNKELTIEILLSGFSGQKSSQVTRSIMWLWKFGLILRCRR